MKQNNIKTLFESTASVANRVFLAFCATILTFAATFSLFVGNVSAAQLTTRSVTLSSAIPSAASTTYGFTFTVPVAGIVRSMQFQFCDTPIGTTCNGVNNPTLGTPGIAAQTGWAQTPAWAAPAVVTNAGGGSATNNQINLTRTGGTSGTNETAIAKTVDFNAITNNATANRTFYVRIRLYTDVAYATLLHDGAVAGSTSQTLTINARVQEVQAFCVGSTTVDNATTSVGAACANITGTDVDMVVIDSGAVSVSPVAVLSGGDNENGVAMIRTNAVNGAVIDYKAVQETSSGKLKVVGATCTGVSITDQCFNSQGTTQAAFTSGTENFGMTVAGINCGSTTSYTCDFSAGTTNLVRDTQYDGDGTNTYQTGVLNSFAWDDTGTADRIASSAGSSVKVIDDEAMVLKFAATTGITTPTGQYTVQADFIAIPTF